MTITSISSAPVQHLTPSPVRRINCGLANRVSANWKRITLIAAVVVAVAAAVAAFFYGFLFLGMASAAVASICLYGAIVVEKNEQLKKLKEAVDHLDSVNSLLEESNKKMTHETLSLKRANQDLRAEIETNKKTTQDLNEFNDDLKKTNTRLEGNLKELESLAEEARYQEAERKKEIESLNSDWAKIHEEIDAFTKEHLEFAKITGLFQQNVHDLENNREELKHFLNDLNIQSQDKRSEIHKNLELVRTIQKQFSTQYQDQKESLKKEIASLHQSIEKMQIASEDQKKLMPPLANIEDRISERTQELQTLETKLNHTKEELRSENQRLELATQSLRIHGELLEKDKLERIKIKIATDELGKKYLEIETVLEKKITTLEQINKKLEENLLSGEAYRT